MIDIKINEDGDTNIAFVRKSDLLANRQIIYLGGNTEKLNYALRRGEEIGFIPEIVFSSQPSLTLYERDIDHIITHESTHIAIYKATESIRATIKLDNIDNPVKRLLTVGGEKS